MSSGPAGSGHAGTLRPRRRVPPRTLGVVAHHQRRDRAIRRPDRPHRAVSTRTRHRGALDAQCGRQRRHRVAADRRTGREDVAGRRRRQLADIAEDQLDRPGEHRRPRRAGRRHGLGRHRGQRASGQVSRGATEHHLDRLRRPEITERGQRRNRLRLLARRPPVVAAPADHHEHGRHDHDDTVRCHGHQTLRAAVVPAWAGRRACRGARRSCPPAVRPAGRRRDDGVGSGRGTPDHGGHVLGRRGRRRPAPPASGVGRVARGAAVAQRRQSPR